MSDMVQVRRGGDYRQRPDVKVGRSQFDRSHGVKMTFDASYLYPILVDEVLPGDTFTLNTRGFARIWSPLDAPIMDNIEIETCYFFVPTRLVWDNWQYFQGEHDAAGAQDQESTIPKYTSSLTVSHDTGSYNMTRLAAYMGLPHGLNFNSVDVNILPFRAYTLIYNEWFRDQNTTDSIDIETGNSGDSSADHQLRKRAKKHDYFTSCLPYLQKGTEQTAALTGKIAVATDALDNEDVGVYQSGDAGWRTMDIGTGTALEMQGSAASEYLYADFELPGSPGGTIGGISINSLREAVAIQRLLERDARGGTRYVEMIKAQFGVTSPDYRLQRPEYLGGGKSYINVSPVANTSEDSSNKQGHLTGVGAGRITGGFAKSFTEHGYVIGIISARADLTYFQGLDRFWSRQTRYDFYMPALAHLGEQGVLNKELYVSNSAGTDDAVFGYQERWAEYRDKQSRIVGTLNPDVSGSLSFWHLAEDFGSVPSLNQTFIEDQSPVNRVTTTDTEDDFIADIWFDYKCARPIPIYSIPSLTSMRF